MNLKIWRYHNTKQFIEILYYSETAISLQSGFLLSYRSVRVLYVWPAAKTVDKQLNFPALADSLLTSNVTFTSAVTTRQMEHSLRTVTH